MENNQKQMNEISNQAGARTTPSGSSGSSSSAQGDRPFWVGGDDPRQGSRQWIGGPRRGLSYTLGNIQTGSYFSYDKNDQDAPVVNAGSEGAPVVNAAGIGEGSAVLNHGDAPVVNAGSEGAPVVNAGSEGAPVVNAAGIGEGSAVLNHVVQNAASQASIQGALVENNEIHDADEWTRVKPKPYRKGRPHVDVGRPVQLQNRFSLLGYENPENSEQGQLDAPSNLPQGQLAAMLNPPVNGNQAQSGPENENPVQNAASQASIQGALVENNEIHDADEWTSVKPKPCRKGRPQLLEDENAEYSEQGQLDAPPNLPQGQLAAMLNPPVKGNRAQSGPENENPVQNAASEASIQGTLVENNEVHHDADEWTSVKPKPCRKGRSQVAVERCVQLQNRFSLLEDENPEERS